MNLSLRGQTMTIDGWTSDPQGNAKVATVYDELGSHRPAKHSDGQPGLKDS